MTAALAPRSAAATPARSPTPGSAAACKPTPVPASAPQVPAKPDAPHDLGSARVVIVDDEPLNRVELEGFLRSLGYRHVVAVVPGPQTLDAVRDERPDLVLLDLSLRRPTAFELLAAMAADRLLRHVPAIALTDQPDRAQRLKALQLGATDCLHKPIDSEELALRLRNTIRAKAHHDGLAYTDGSTGLPNRASSLHQLDWALKFARRHAGIGAVLQVGLDRFKQINDALGSTQGDDLLRAVGQRLLGCLRDTDLLSSDSSADQEAQVARGDGDEFTLLLPALARGDDAAVVAQRIVDAMAQPFLLAGQEIFVSCQIGIAVFGGEIVDRDVVLRQAKLAMRHRRDAGATPGAGFGFYSQEFNLRLTRKLALERELHHALERDELLLHYQPKADVHSGRICGVEALVRWQHPQRGLLSPEAFIDAAEECGLIVPLGEWVLREALRQTAAWRRAGLPPVTVAVNVSSMQFQQPQLVATVRDALSRNGLDGASLCLELTESAIIGTGTRVTDVLRSLKALGLCLALDDFGTGYSSLSYLRSFPIDELKIDRSFITDCETTGSSAAPITRAIITMAHAMGMRVVAEGVERPPQLQFLRANGCDQYQGYLCSRPLPSAEFAAMLVAGAGAGAAAALPASA